MKNKLTIHDKEAINKMDIEQIKAQLQLVNSHVDLFGSTQVKQRFKKRLEKRFNKLTIRRYWFILNGINNLLDYCPSYSNFEIHTCVLNLDEKKQLEKLLNKVMNSENIKKIENFVKLRA